MDTALHLTATDIRGFSDTYWGRYKTICWSVLVAMVGHVILVVSGLPPVLENTNGAFACLIIAMLVMGAGTGGFKSNISPLVADQMNNAKAHLITLSSGERVVVDPTVTVSRIYMVCRFHHGPRLFQTTLLIYVIAVFLPLHQCRRSGWPDRNDLLRKGTLT